MNCFGILSIAVLVASQIFVSEGVKCVFYGEPGSGFTGEQMANGEYYNPNALTCSTLSHLPLGSTLQVTNQRNGRTITVRVTDRIGGGSSEDTIDLTYGAFGLLANHEDGEIPCSYSLL